MQNESNRTLMTRIHRIHTDYFDILFNYFFHHRDKILSVNSPKQAAARQRFLLFPSRESGGIHQSAFAGCYRTIKTGLRVPRIGKEPEFDCFRPSTKYIPNEVRDSGLVFFRFFNTLLRRK
jgi:hypothetical protein